MSKFDVTVWRVRQETVTLTVEAETPEAAEEAVRDAYEMGELEDEDWSPGEVLAWGEDEPMSPAPSSPAFQAEEHEGD